MWPQTNHSALLQPLQQYLYTHQTVKLTQIPALDTLSIHTCRGGVAKYHCRCRCCILIGVGKPLIQAKPGNHSANQHSAYSDTLLLVGRGHLRSSRACYYLRSTCYYEAHRSSVRARDGQGETAHCDSSSRKQSDVATITLSTELMTQ